MLILAWSRPWNLYRRPNFFVMKTKALRFKVEFRISLFFGDSEQIAGFLLSEKSLPFPQPRSISFSAFPLKPRIFCFYHRKVGLSNLNSKVLGGLSRYAATREMLTYPVRKCNLLPTPANCSLILV